MEISADAQGYGVLVDLLDEMRRSGPFWTGQECADKAAAALKECMRVRLEAMPIPLPDITEAEDGARMNLPANVLYMLSITEDGEATVCKADVVRTAEQHAWLHGLVIECANALAGDASGGKGLN